HAQRLLCLWRPHRHRDDLAAVLVPEPGGMRDRVGVEGVQLERDALANERLRLLVEADRVAPGHLLDEADDLHVRETTPLCWGCSTTSTGTCRRSRRCSQTPIAPESIAGCSAATTARRAPGRSRRWDGCGSSRTPPGFAGTASAGCASRRTIGPRCVP